MLGLDEYGLKRLLGIVMPKWQIIVKECEKSCKKTAKADVFFLRYSQCDLPRTRTGQHERVYCSESWTVSGLERRIVGLIKTYDRIYSRVDPVFSERNIQQKMTCEEALKIYRNRDVVEKFYRTMKSGMGFDKFGVTNDASAYNKTYVVFIASIIWAEMNTKLRVERENRNNRKDFTVPAAIAELENIEVSRINKDGGYSRRYALTKKQKDILSVIGANETAVRSAAERLNKRLVIKDKNR